MPACGSHIFKFGYINYKNGDYWKNWSACSFYGLTEKNSLLQLPYEIKRDRLSVCEEMVIDSYIKLMSHQFEFEDACYIRTGISVAQICSICQKPFVWTIIICKWWSHKQKTVFSISLVKKILRRLFLNVLSKYKFLSKFTFFIHNRIKLFLTNVPFLSPMKTSEYLWCFQGRS